MIIKFYELHNLDLNQYKFFLLHGQNNGAKQDEIDKISKKHKQKTIYKFEEKFILDNLENFYDEIFSGSLFDSEKLILINNVTDKIFKIIEEIINKNIDNTYFLLNAAKLEKKSKLRTFFEKDQQLVCTAFYPDTTQTLSILINKFFKEKKISISQTNINVIISKNNGDRDFLYNELKKIELYLLNKKNINSYELYKLLNIIENHDINELINNCMINNSKKVIQTLNENNISNEDCIIIIRSFLAKAKKILKLANNYAKNNNLEMTISETRPPIFWKEKDTIKLQIQKWKPDKLKKLISKIYQTELLIKKNSQFSINILMNFIFEQISSQA